MKKASIILLIAIFLSCNSTKWDSDLLKGDWKVSEWKQVSTDKEIVKRMDFSFDGDIRYSIDYGSDFLEEGKYWIYGTFLHTVEDGKTEKKVKIINLEQNKFVFEMNRGGIIERVILHKE